MDDDGAAVLFSLLFELGTSSESWLMDSSKLPGGCLSRELDIVVEDLSEARICLRLSRRVNFESSALT